MVNQFKFINSNPDEQEVLSACSVKPCSAMDAGTLDDEFAAFLAAVESPGPAAQDCETGSCHTSARVPNFVAILHAKQKWGIKQRVLIKWYEPTDRSQVWR